MSNKETFKRIVNSESPEVLVALFESMAEHIAGQKKLIEILRVEQAEREQRSFLIEEKLKLIRRDLYGRSREERSDASDRPRERSQSENLLFSQAMFPTDEVRDESGKTIKTRWDNLETLEVVVPITAYELEEESKLRGIERRSLEKWEDLWEEIPNAYASLTQIEIIERRYIVVLARQLLYKSA